MSVKIVIGNNSMSVTELITDNNEKLLLSHLRKGNKSRKLVILRSYLKNHKLSAKKVCVELRNKLKFLSMGERLAKLASNGVSGLGADPSKLNRILAQGSFDRLSHGEEDFVTKIANKGFFDGCKPLEQGDVLFYGTKNSATLMENPLVAEDGVALDKLCEDFQGTVINPELIYKPDVSTVYSGDSEIAQIHNERIAATLVKPIPTSAKNVTDALSEHNLMHVAAYEQVLENREPVKELNCSSENPNISHMKAGLEEYRTDPQAYFNKRRDRMNLNMEKRKGYKQRYLNLKKVLNNFTQG